VPLITVGSIQGDTTGFKNIDHIEVIKLIGDGKGKDSEVGKWSLGFQR